MKTIKIIYWSTTAIIGFMMTYSAYAYITQDAMHQGFIHLGFPAYFRIELAIAKFAGAILLLAPVSARVKEWVYAGFTFTFISAFIAHTASGDPVSNRAAPIIFLMLLVASYWSYHKLHSSASNDLTRQPV